MKSEPGEFSIEDLRKRKKHYWDGVRNYEARNNMRKMEVGDLIVFYHSQGEPSGPAGIARVVRTAYPDFTQWKRGGKYFDPRGTRHKPIWDMVDVAFVKKFRTIIERNLLREIPALRNMVLWKKLRLSVTPLTQKEFETIVKLGTK